MKPKQGFIAAAVREFYTDFLKVKHDNPNLVKALKFAKKMFRTKCVQVSSEWLKQRPELIPKEEQQKFSKNWIQDLMKEYNVSLRKPNKRFAIKNEDRIIRIKDYFQNIWTVRKYFLDTYGVDPPIINGDQVPLQRNESTGQKALSLKSEETFVKEN